MVRRIALVAAAACSVVVSSQVRPSDARVRQEPGALASTSRTPKFEYGGSDGCGSVFVYAWSRDHTEVFRVWWDMWTALGIPTAKKPTWDGSETFNLRDAPKWLDVAVDLHASSDYSLFAGPAGEQVRAPAPIVVKTFAGRPVGG